MTFLLVYNSQFLARRLYTTLSVKVTSPRIENQFSNTIVVQDFNSLSNFQGCHSPKLNISSVVYIYLIDLLLHKRIWLQNIFLEISKSLHNVVN